MVKVAIEFTYYVDIIEVPDYIAKDIKKYQRAFDKWLYDKDNNHGLWVIVDGQKKAVSFDTQDFVDYLNRHAISNSDSVCRVIESSLLMAPPNLPIVFF